MIFNKIRAEILATAYMKSKFYNPLDNDYDKAITVTDWILHQVTPMSIIEQQNIMKVLPKLEAEAKKDEVNNNMNNENTEKKKGIQRGPLRGVLETAGVNPNAEIGTPSKKLADKFIEQVGYEELKDITCNEFEHLVAGFVYSEKEHESKIAEVLYIVAKRLKKKW